MRIFRDKAREQFLEGKVKELLEALEVVKKARDSIYFSSNSTKENLDIAEGKVLKATAEIQACYATIATLRKLVDTTSASKEAYKTDNMTLIARVAHLQDSLHESLRQFSKQSEDMAALRANAEKAKAKKKKGSKKKRK
jgi:chromosome segregation ATPase